MRKLFHEKIDFVLVWQSASLQARFPRLDDDLFRLSYQIALIRERPSCWPTICGTNNGHLLRPANPQVVNRLTTRLKPRSYPIITKKCTCFVDENRLERTPNEKDEGYLPELQSRACPQVMLVSYYYSGNEIFDSVAMADILIDDVVVVPPLVHKSLPHRFASIRTNLTVWQQFVLMVGLASQRTGQHRVRPMCDRYGMHWPIFALCGQSTSADVAKRVRATLTIPTLFVSAAKFFKKLSQGDLGIGVRMTHHLVLSDFMGGSF
ncbi:MAG: hypothetical protein HC858_07450 [Brachymonas sp.]|nr:hypothetical protein [Brachymonas sp.]